MEAEGCHDLLPASWRPMKAGGVIQPESEVMRTKGGGSGVNLSPRGA